MEKQITVTRIFNAPVELVWKTWIDPELVKRWWGPDMFTCPSAKIDFRVGGQSIVCMKGPEAFDGGKNHYSIWTYKEIIPLKKIEFIQNLADEAGNKMDPVVLGMPPDFPVDIRTLVTFKELEKGKTEMTVTEFADMGQMAKFAQMGLEQSIAKMDAIFIS